MEPNERAVKDIIKEFNAIMKSQRKAGFKEGVAVTCAGMFLLTTLAFYTEFKASKKDEEIIEEA